MTAKVKAVELVQRFTAHAKGSDGEQNWINVKNCALIAVDEILETVFTHKNSYEYWQEV